MAEVWGSGKGSGKGSGDRRSIASRAGRGGLRYRISEAPDGLRQSVEVGIVLGQLGDNVGDFELMATAGYGRGLAHPNKRRLP